MSNKKNSDKDQKEPAQKDGIRETIESIVIAFVFAFLFRTFEAEAFVIPTGSMAPTLFGRHKDVDCEACGYHFHVGASEEIESSNQEFLPRRRIHTADCPNCQFRNNVRELSAFSGDRILVNKFPYEIGNPQRWDVPVFKYPENPGTNFIKRLVGMPGETIRIRQGNVFAKKNDKEGWYILRKENPDKQRAIQILVYNNDYHPTQLLKKGWPECWAAVIKNNAEGHIAGWSEDDSGWKPGNDKTTFRINSQLTADGQHRWLRYRHFVPSEKIWNQFRSGQFNSSPSSSQFFDESLIRPRLVSDYTSYNSHSSPVASGPSEGFYWNGELTIDAEFKISKVNKGGELLLELNQGPRKFRCRFNLETGAASLVYDTGLSVEGDDEQVIATTSTSVKGAGTYHVSFANVDNRLCLWVNNSLVNFGNDKGKYPPFGGYDSVTLPENDDLIPVGIAAKKVDVSVAHLIVRRDIYYRADFLNPKNQSLPESKEHYASADRPVNYNEYARSPQNLINLHQNPIEYGHEYQKYALWNYDQNQRTEVSTDVYELKLDEGEYLMLGDNSPASSDSRLWRNTRQAKHRYAVPREAFVGKAFYIYWPHAIPFMNNGKGFTIKEYEKSFPEDKPYPKYSAPFYPNFNRMRRIR